MHGLGLALAFGFALAGLIIGAITLPDSWWLLSWVGFPTVGAFILWKRPGHRMGRLLLFIGLAWSLTFFLEALLDGGMTDLASVWVEMLSSILGYSAFVALALIPVLFPHGTPATGFDRFLGRALLVVWGAVVLAELDQPGTQGDHRSGEPAGPTWALELLGLHARPGVLSDPAAPPDRPGQPGAEVAGQRGS